VDHKQEDLDLLEEAVVAEEVAVHPLAAAAGE